MAEDIEKGPQASPLDMSDEAFLEAPIPTDPVEDLEVVTDVSTTEGDTDVEPNTEEEETPPEGEDEDDPEHVEAGGEESDENVPKGSEEAPAADKPDEQDDTTTETEVPDEVDKGTEYDKIMGSFKANGGTMQMKSAEDVITLMQMGANYHKKMSDIKPAMKMVKLLDKNGLMDLDKINYLIDLSNKNPEAIAQLVADSGIDPLDIDTKQVDYTPESRSVSDTEFAIDEAIESIQNTPTFNKTLNVITTEWDDASRNIIATEPSIIRVINGQMENGVFDKIVDAVSYERSMGRLAGYSDLEAYRAVGDTLHKQGLLFPQEQQTPQDQPTPNDPTSTEKGKKKAAALRKKKKAASSTKSNSSSTPKDYDPLNMSDDEFLKFDVSKFK